MNGFGSFGTKGPGKELTSASADLQPGMQERHWPVGGGVVELKIDYGPGYWVYFIHRGMEIVVLLCGGDKSSQSKDIKTAKMLALQDEEGSNGA